MSNLFIEVETGRQLLVNGQTAHIGTGSHFSDFPT
jgi:hypothetical protein